MVYEEGNGQAHGADETRHQARAFERVFPGEAEGLGDARELRRLDGVKGVIPPEHEGHRAFQALHDKGLEALGGIDAELRREGLNRSSLRRSHERGALGAGRGAVGARAGASSTFAA